MSLSKIVFLAAIFLILVPYVGDNDFWLHLRIGEIIIEENHFPRTDPLSFTGSGEEFINHEWLPQIIFYLLLDVGGFLSVTVFAAVVGVILFGLLLYRKQLSWPLMVFLCVVAYSFKPFIVPRPQIFAYLLLLGLMLVIERKKLYLIPLILFLWANIHASVILALPILFIVFIFERDRKFLFFSLIGLAATLINPFGYKIYWHALQPIRFSEAYHYLLETRPIYKLFPALPHLLVTHLAVIFLAATNLFRTKFKVLKPYEAILCLMFLAMPFVAVKYLPFAWAAVLLAVIKTIPDPEQ